MCTNQKNKKDAVFHCHSPIPIFAFKSTKCHRDLIEAKIKDIYSYYEYDDSYFDEINSEKNERHGTKGGPITECKLRVLFQTISKTPTKRLNVGLPVTGKRGRIVGMDKCLNPFYRLYHLISFQAALGPPLSTFMMSVTKIGSRRV